MVIYYCMVMRQDQFIEGINAAGHPFNPNPNRPQKRLAVVGHPGRTKPLDQQQHRDRPARGWLLPLLGPDDRTWVSGTVLELVPEKSLILSWLEEGSGWLNPARLVIRLSPLEDGTQVVLIHDGFEGIGLPDWAETLKGYELGADVHRVLDRLADLVEASDDRPQ